MLKKLLILLPLVLPTLAYVGYIVLRHRRLQAAGHTTEAPPWWEEAPWGWLVGLGVGLAALTLFVWALAGPETTSSTYVPPRYEDGRLIEEQFVAPPAEENGAATGGDEPRREPLPAD